MEKLMHRELCKSLEYNHTAKCYVYKLKSTEWNAKNSPWFWDTNGSPNPGQVWFGFFV